MDAVGRRMLLWAPLRRLLFFGLTFGTGLSASALLLDVLKANELSAVELVGLVLFFTLFAWISGAAWTAVAGAAVQLAGRDPAGLDPNEVSDRPLHTRTAIVMPIYNEDPQRVAAGLEAIWGSLARQRERDMFDLFILSDSGDGDIATQEELMWRLFLARHQAAGRVFYRRRRERSQRKAGNIADFVQRWGADYECMIVLDADSIMSGEALVTLARLMEAHPGVGILQSLPLPMGRMTLFGRLIQFGARLQSPMLARGLAFWQLGESNYWGHNAIIRLRPFAHHCSLPRLPGKPPLGGDILSHDFVEAAFMRRAGYEVWQLPGLPGSWEEVPANVIDYAARDRRWTQGNLQHARVLRFPGLHPLSRLHFVTGIMSYVSSPMWLALLLLSSVVSAIESAKTPQYFLPGFRSLFPHWPQNRAAEGMDLFVLTLVVLLLPKVLGAVLAIRDRQMRAQFGGTLRLCVSLLIEQVFSVLLAPSMMLFHSTFVIQTLLGHCVSWIPQARTDRGVTLREAFRRQKWQLLFGVIWGALVLRLAPHFFWWVSPVLVGLVFGTAVTAWTSRVDLGDLARRYGLLLVPEETRPAPELVALERAKAGDLCALLATDPGSTASADMLSAQSYAAAGQGARQR
jgi:membrane glycosyltransferase